MKKLEINPNNKKYYSEEFIKGFECGVERQFNADMKDKTAEWIFVDNKKIIAKCSNCTLLHDTMYGTRYCPNCGAKMKGENNV